MAGFPIHNNDFSSRRRGRTIPEMLATLLTAVLAGLSLAGCPNTAADARHSAVPQENIAVKPGSVAPLRLNPAARLDRRLLPECSGLAASKKYPGVFWALSDSGNAPFLVAIRADGSVVKPPDAPRDYKGVALSGAANVDWEAVTVDNLGRVIVADLGNNRSNRRNLCLLAFPEPDPLRDTAVTPRRIPVRHAGQTAFPDPRRRFDCEAIFLWNNKVHALTKRRSDTWTVLSRLQMQPDGSGVFHPVTSFNSLGMVTDAAVSPDGRHLAILTYHSIWVFVLPAPPPPAPPPPPANTEAPAGPHPLSGAVFYRPLQFPLEHWQVEAVAFADDDHLLIASEQGALYTLALNQLEKVR